MIRGLGLLAGAATVLAATPASAQDWQVRAIPYIWASGLDGDASVVAALPPAEVSDSFGDVLDNLDIAFFGAVEARRDKLFLRTDLAYASVTSRGETPGNLFSGVELTSKTFNISGMAGYVVHDAEGARVDLFAGGRFWNVKNDLDFLAGTLPAQSVEASRSFFDPLVGISTEFQLSRKLSGALSGTIGGFGVGADLEYGATAALFYSFNDNWGMAAGYRYLSVDFEEDEFVYDMAQHGPVIGLFFDF